MLNGKKGNVFVIYAAAPNFRYINRYGREAAQPITYESMEQAMRERQEIAYLMAATTGAEVFVAGAWGCGVFANDPILVAKGWKDCEHKYPGVFRQIVHPIPNAESKNHRAFKQVFG